MAPSNNLGCVMRASVPTPRERANGRSQPVLVAVLVAAIGLLFLVELPLPENLPTGVAEMVPVLIACFYLDRRWSAAILTLAVLTRVAEATLGDTPIELAVVEVASYIGSYAVALAYTRRPVRVPAAAAVADKAPLGPPRIPSPASLEASGLTDRERQVVDMTIRGLTATQIGERLFIGRRTVESHLERACGKLGVRTKRDLIAWAFDAGGEPAIHFPDAPNTLNP
jgi:DNA-binding CsgD family transcriptional regulator